MRGPGEADGSRTLIVLVHGSSAARKRSRRSRGLPGHLSPRGLLHPRYRPGPFSNADALKYRTLSSAQSMASIRSETTTNRTGGL